MSQTNILNPWPTSPFNPTWGYAEGLPDMDEVFQAASGAHYSRQIAARGHVYELGWERLSRSDAIELQRWARQYRHDFFTLQDLEKKRYFSGRFESELQTVWEGNDQVSLRGRFLEIPGLAMYEYPLDWARDAIFLEERNGLGEDLTKRVGTWTYGAQATAHGGAELVNAGTVTTDYLEILYFGYGFRYYSRKDTNLGKVELSLDDTIVAATLDLYAAAAAPAAAVHTQANVSLGLHRVKARALNSKNAASSDFKVIFDAIEAMQ